MLSFRPLLCLLLTILSLFDNRLYAQGFNDRYKYSSLEISQSNAYFLGKDLPFKSNRSFSPGVSFAVMTRQSARISNGFKFSLNFPTSRTIGKRDSLSETTFIYFQTRVQKYEFFLMTDLIQHRGKYQKRPNIVPYLYTGIGWMKFKHFMRYGFEDKEAVAYLTNNRFAKRSFILPIGMGLRYKLSKTTDLSLEVIYNYTFTNQLDLDYLHNFIYSKNKDSYLSVNLKLGIF